MISAPANSRQLIELLGNVNSIKEFEAYIERIYFQNVRPLQIYYSVLGRLPESGEAAASGRGYVPQHHFRNAILGKEFRSKILPFLLNAVPEKRRLLFVHIPKCAGTDLACHLASRYASLSFRIADRFWISDDTFFKAINDFVNSIKHKDTLLLHGHVTLDWLLSNNLVRYGDSPFAIIRDPLAMVLSSINYIVGRLLDDPCLKSVDTRDWARVMDLDTIPEAPSRDFIQALGKQVLRNPEVIQPNVLCLFLGRGTAESSLDLMARSDIEIIPIEWYNSWLQSRWNITTDTRRNASKQFVLEADLDAEDEKYIGELIKEDQKLYEHVMRCFAKAQREWIHGTELI